MIKEAVPRIVGFGEAIEEPRLVGLWRQILDVFRGGLLADWLVLDPYDQCQV